ncbi:hypothetical protein [Bythopirellula polymerisocia]|uniref:Uncharacterized protein n=1 Tax=Bythopirellula polymerisocia TaxID=2528003 RepID=A0A5C6CS52_9BACT|nr:hypothetical protein [Bythopirellula polymerisocia]TWU25906.1 hypothetical protein Pla144_31200 [Bythopirellula polymerisocia]
MAIQVICPGCHTRFKVGDEHAGKSGACPKCKGEIKIPELGDEVVIHAPEMEAGAKDAKGRNVLKPIKRKETKFSTNIFVMVAGGVLLSVVIAFLLGRSDIKDTWVLALGAILLGPPLAYAGYTFLRDDELGVYQGTDVLIRSLACGWVYALLWGVYVYVGWNVFGEDAFKSGLEMLHLSILSGLVMGIGTFAAYVSFDLEPISAFFHYALYFLVTVLLRFVMDLPFLPGMKD